MAESRPPSQSLSVASSAAASRASPSLPNPQQRDGHGSGTHSPVGSAAAAPPAGPASSSTSAIVVAMRKRPKLVQKEQDENDVVRCSDDGGTVVVYEPRTKLDLTPIIEPNSFSFDHVFSEQSTNAEVYEQCCRPLLENVRDGGGAVIFAFGQTGSGKTYTMLGDRSSPGLYGLAVTELLSMTGGGGASSTTTSVSPSLSACGLSASFYEVYGTKLFDLLNDRAEVKMLQDEYKNIHIVGLTERDVCSVDDVNALMTSGQLLRAIGTTHANDRSSRSHAVLEIKVKPGPGSAVAGDSFGRITFVDLAGSERASDTAGTDAKTRREGAEINKSLLALKECIRAMSMRKRHIPFRGSKLTQILRESFTGRCRTSVIATISPCQSHCEDTLNTLRYADRIKELKGPAGGGAGAVGLQTPTPCRNCGLPIFVGDRHVCRRQVVECPHCRRVLDKGDLEQHMAECKEVPMRCPHCNERMLRAELPRHNRRCFRLPVRCPGCGQQVARNLMEKHTLTECGGAKEKCRHCNLPFPRQIVASHESSCDAMRVACPHCLKYIRQKRLDAHVAMCFLNPSRVPTIGAGTGGGTGSGGVGSSPRQPSPQQQPPPPPPPPPQRGRSSAASTPSRRVSPDASFAHSLHGDAVVNATADGLPAQSATPHRQTLSSTAKYPRTSQSFDAATAAGKGQPPRRSSAARFPSVSGTRRQQRVVDGEFQTSCSLDSSGTGSGVATGAGGVTCCPYARYGCPAKVSRLNLPAHLTECVEEHLQLVTSYADTLDTQNAELRRLVVSVNR